MKMLICELSLFGGRIKSWLGFIHLVMAKAASGYTLMTGSTNDVR